MRRFGVLLGLCLLWPLLACAPDAADRPPAPEAPASTEAPLGPERVERYRQDCDRGEARGCAALGSLHRSGEAGVPADLKKARALYEQACAAQVACARLGALLLEPEAGPVDPIRAGALFDQACAAGDPDGCMQQVALVRAQEPGLARDAQVRGLLSRACTLGSARGCTNLGYLAEHGRGGSRDLELARESYQKGCEGGVTAACNNLGLVSKIQTPTPLSPRPGSQVGVDVLPIALALPAELRDVLGWTLLLDGQPVDSTDLCVSDGPTSVGRGARALATLDLSSVAPGPHELTWAFGQGELAQRVVVPFGVLGDRSPVVLRAVDADGAPIAVRVAVFLDGAPVPMGGPDMRAMDTNDRDTRWNSVFLGEEASTLRLAPGTYELVATAGLRHGLSTQTVTVPAAAPVEFVLAEQVPTPGWQAVDLHVHTARSRDAWTPHRLRLASLAASGLDAAVLSDHDVVGPVLADSPVHLIPGAELTVPLRAPHAMHFNLFPVAAPTRGPIDPVSMLGPAGSGGLRQLNHPRGIQFLPEEPPGPLAHALFTQLDQAPGSLGPDSLDAWLAAHPQAVEGVWGPFDLLEVVNRFGFSLAAQTHRDWHGLLNAGVRLPATGNSDSHAMAVELAGMTITLVHTGAGVPQTDALLDGLRAGASSVSTGPVVDLQIVDAAGRQVGLGELGTRAGVRAQIRVRAADWVPVPQVRLVANGIVLWSATLPERAGPLDQRFEVPLDLSEDAWISAEAGFAWDDPDPQPGGLYARLAPGYVPLGFTNPIYLDQDGDGRWTAPGQPVAPAF